MSSVPQEPPSRGPALLQDLLKQVVTLSVASIGFLFAIRSAGHVDAGFLWAYRIALGGFLLCIISALYGQIALVSAAFREPSRLPNFLRNGRSWFVVSWVGFGLGFAGFLVLAFQG
jgi:energy-converting hydrogenase Eha subunit C